MSSSAKPKGKIKVRPMEPEDIEGILAIDRKFAGGKRSVTYADPRGDFMGGDVGLSCVAEVAGKTVGFVLGRLKDSPYGRSDIGWLQAIGVDPEYQHQGVGGKLVEAFIERCRSKGAKSVRTMVSWHDIPLLALLRTQGFSRGDVAEFQKML